MNSFKCKTVFLLVIISEKNHWVTLIQKFVLVLYIFTFSKIKVQMTKIYISVSSLQFNGIILRIIPQKTACKNSYQSLRYCD